MSFRPTPERLFGDILDAISMIEQFTSRMDFEAFRSNPMAVAAVERKLQLISEAAIRLGSAVAVDLPSLKATVVRAVNQPRP